MSKRAFALREDAKESFADAATVRGGRRVRVSDYIRKDNGEIDVNAVIVSDDPAEQAALERIASLKEVQVPTKSSGKPRGKNDQAGPAGEEG